MNEQELINYYNKFNEDKRLNSRHGQVEFITTMHYIHEFLKDKKELNNLLKYIFNNAPENFDIIVGNMELVTDYYYNFSDDFLENKYWMIFL